MADAAQISRPEQGTVASIVGAPADNLSIATHDGQLNGGTYQEWLEGMRLRQTMQRQILEWVKATAELCAACKTWAAINQEWVKEIAVRFNAEPASVSLYVVVTNLEHVTIDRRRHVADMGLVIGAAFNVRAEARITSTRPPDHTFVVE